MSKSYCPACLKRGFEENCPVGKEKQHARSKIHQICVIANDFETQLNEQHPCYSTESKDQQALVIQELHNSHQIELLEQKQKYEALLADKQAALSKYIDSVESKKKTKKGKKSPNAHLDAAFEMDDKDISDNSDDEYLIEGKKKIEEDSRIRQQKQKEEDEKRGKEKRKLLKK